MLSFATIKLIKADIKTYIASGSTGFPQFSTATKLAVDLEADGAATKVENALGSTPINWAQIIATLLPILLQLIPLLVSLFGGNTPTPAPTPTPTPTP